MLGLWKIHIKSKKIRPQTKPRKIWNILDDILGAIRFEYLNLFDFVDFMELYKILC